MGSQQLAARVVAVIACLALGSGCFGYNRSAKRWAYVGDTVLLLGGGAAIAGDLLLSEDDAPCMANRACPDQPPVSGALVAGVVLATAGLIGILINATRPTVKTSR